MKYKEKDFEIKCKKCGSTSIHIYARVAGGCPSCGSWAELELTCNGCGNSEDVDGANWPDD